MRLAAMIPRLTPPRMVRGSALPSFNQICRPAAGNHQDKIGEEPLLFSTVSDQVTLPELFSAFDEENSMVPRSIWIGEQHHQPKVLSSQLQIINQIFQACNSSQKIHVIMEHWSLADQPMLNELNAQDEDAFDPRSMAEEESTSEGFNMSHYLTIIKLVRELGGTVWAGFPPRSWAKMISKSQDCVFDEIKKLDQDRYSAHSGSIQEDRLIPPLSSKDYQYVENISWPHRIYLKNMFRPDKRPEIPSEAEKEPPKEMTGFLAAQALKDTFLAHTMASILAKDPNNVVVAVAGLGHCEWGHGAPERLRAMTGLEPYIIMTKPEDSGYWSALPTSEPLASQWTGRQADVVVLYEWVD